MSRPLQKWIGVIETAVRPGAVVVEKGEVAKDSVVLALATDLDDFKKRVGAAVNEYDMDVIEFKDIELYSQWVTHSESHWTIQKLVDRLSAAEPVLFDVDWTEPRDG